MLTFQRARDLNTFVLSPRAECLFISKSTSSLSFKAVGRKSNCNLSSYISLKIQSPEVPRLWYQPPDMHSLLDLNAVP